ncbi:MAG TPA: pinensin family lanthipeptide [Longimicrobium sp.]|nr:pinensin family lanthipeptide [Longimicrobium sp.]
MKKLSLKLDELQVESFETQDNPRQRGTVQANCACGVCCCCPCACTAQCTAWGHASCAPNASCGHTYCNQFTCAASCEGTCRPSQCYETCPMDPCGV